MPVTLDASAPDFEAAFDKLLNAKREDSPDVDAVVADIIADVRARGDAAVIELSQKFDRVTLTPATLRITAAEVDAAVAEVSPEDRRALELAADRIRAYHARQLPDDAEWTDPDGATLGWRWTPVSAAGLYVPGGLASYPSSVLMNAIPAKVAGVERLAMVVPTPDGVLNPLVLLAAGIGITPIMSILKTTLDAMPDRETILIHGCLTDEVQPFKTAIDELASTHPNLNVHYRYSDVAQDDVPSDGNCSVGMVDAELIESLVPDRHADYYFCGPKPFMINIYQDLLMWGIPATQVHFEFFGPRQDLEKAA